MLRRASAVICVSEALLESARKAGIANAVFIPNGIAIPETVAEEAQPLEVSLTGRLSPEKGVQDLVRAAEGLNLVVCGDGPLRDLVPQDRGFVPREELERRFEDAADRRRPVARRRLRRRLRRGDGAARPVVRLRLSRGLVRPWSGTTSPACSSSRATSPGSAPRSTSCSSDAELRRGLGAAARRRISFTTPGSP